MSSSLSFKTGRKPDPSTLNPSTKRRTKHATSSSSLIMKPPSNLFPSKIELLKLIAVVTVAVSVNYAATFLNRAPKPFCDSAFELDYSYSSDSCELCPSNGKCHEGKLECNRGYRKVGKLCVEDGDTIETAKKLSELVERRVCEAFARYLCEGVGAAWTQEVKVWNDLDESILKENLGLDSDVYAYAKQRATETTNKLLESRTSGEGVKELGCPQMLVKNYTPITCLVRQWIVKHAMVLVPLFMLLTGSALLIFRLRQRFYLSNRAEQLYNQVCDILEEHALMSRSSNSEGEPWVIASWLRDHLLLPKERKDPTLWKKVEELVQEDSRLDRCPRIVKGESKVVWEWQVEGSLSSSRKKMKSNEIKLKETERVVPSSKQYNWGQKARQLLNI